MKRITDSVIFLLLTTYKRFITSIARAEKNVFDEKLRKIKRSIPYLSRMKDNSHTPQNKNMEQNKDRLAERTQFTKDRKNCYDNTYIKLRFCN